MATFLLLGDLPFLRSSYLDNDFLECLQRQCLMQGQEQVMMKSHLKPKSSSYSVGSLLALLSFIPLPFVLLVRASL